MPYHASYRRTILAAALIALAGCAGGEDGSSMQITSVAPSHGSMRGGEEVTVTGVDLGTSPSVFLGDLRATVQSATDTQVVIVTPASTEPGPVDVRVRRGGGSAVLEDGFTYAGIPMHFIDITLTNLTPYEPCTGRIASMTDFDGDGDLDIVQAVNGRVRIYLNDGQGSFTAIPDTAIPEDAEGFTNEILVGDFNGDGRNDLYLVNYNDLQDRLLMASSSGTSFTDRTETNLPEEADSTLSGETADLDGDGDLDIVLTNYKADAEYTPTVSLLVNNGAGVFREEAGDLLPETQMGAFAVAAGDVDGDGSTDLFFSAMTEDCRLFLNDGEGVFLEAPPGSLPDMASPSGRIPAMGDIDGDGSLDIYLPSTEQDRILLNDGTGRFTEQTRLSMGEETDDGYTAVIVDLDLDTFADVVVANAPGRVTILHNDGEGRFYDYSSSIPANPGGIANIAAAAGDIDGDGDPDLFLSQADSGWPVLLLNWDPLAMDDRDGDGVPDDADNCPRKENPDQANADMYHFACRSKAACAANPGCDLAVDEGGSAYLLCSAETKSWQDAQTFCRERGADLVTVNDADENEFLAGLGVGNQWIGLNDVDTEGTYEWSDGSTSSFDSWGENQPDNAGTAGEDCAGFLPEPAPAGAWNDWPCATLLGYICEDDLLELPPDPGDACDNCPGVYNPDQDDEDDDTIGDDCDAG
jgi:hypothetical protein